jgi:hypothetical protein
LRLRFTRLWHETYRGHCGLWAGAGLHQTVSPFTQPTTPRFCST